MSLRQKPNAAKAHVTGFKANSMKSKYIYGTEIKQIMFVAGENAAIARQTLELVEDIVKGQLIEMVCALLYYNSVPTGLYTCGFTLEPNI